MKKKRNTVLIIQARLTSKRFPSKVIKMLDKKPIIFFLLERLKKCKKVDEIVFDIPDTKKNHKLYKREI